MSAGSRPRLWTPPPCRNRTRSMKRGFLRFPHRSLLRHRRTRERNRKSKKRHLRHLCRQPPSNHSIRPRTAAGQVSDDRREPVPVSLKDGNVQIAFLDPAETSKPDEPQAKPRSRRIRWQSRRIFPVRRRRRSVCLPSMRPKPNAPRHRADLSCDARLAGGEWGAGAHRTPLTLTELQQTAMCRNPLIRQAASDVEAARGR